MDTFRIWVGYSHPDVIVISETWLNSNIYDSDLNLLEVITSAEVSTSV